MKEDQRLRDVQEYNISTTSEDKKLNELTELASLLCNTPISLVTILDSKGQWFKAKKGMKQKGSSIEDSFCQYTFNKPNDLLVVNDALKDPRFCENRFVTSDPNIRFYAGAPLVTKQKNVLGTLCVLDNKPKKISKGQQRGLKLLAKRVMDEFEHQKILHSQSTSIDLTTERLLKMTEHLPIGIFELKAAEDGKISFNFLSQGMNKLHPDVNLDMWIEDPSLGFSLVHPDDIEGLRQSIQAAFSANKKLYHEYRIVHDGEYHWHAMNGKAYKNAEGEMLMCGSFTDVTHHFEYEDSLDQILYDISHVLRRPVTSMLGITNLIKAEENFSEEKFKEYSTYLETIADELNDFTRKLNDVYLEKKVRVGNPIKRITT